MASFLVSNRNFEAKGIVCLDSTFQPIMTNVRIRLAPKAVTDIRMKRLFGHPHHKLAINGKRNSRTSVGQLGEKASVLSLIIAPCGISR